MVRVFTNVLRDQGSIPGQIISKTQKMVLDASLLNTQHYKIPVKCKWSNAEKGVSSFLHLGVCAVEKSAFRLFSTTISQLNYVCTYNMYVSVFMYM